MKRVYRIPWLLQNMLLKDMLLQNMMLLQNILLKHVVAKHVVAKHSTSGLGLTFNLVSFLNQDLFDLRKIYVVNLKTGCSKKMPYVGEFPT